MTSVLGETDCQVLIFHIFHAFYLKVVFLLTYRCEYVIEHSLKKPIPVTKIRTNIGSECTSGLQTTVILNYQKIKTEKILHEILMRKATTSIENFLEKITSIENNLIQTVKKQILTRVSNFLICHSEAQQQRD